MSVLIHFTSSVVFAVLTFAAALKVASQPVAERAETLAALTTFVALVIIAALLTEALCRWNVRRHLKRAALLNRLRGDG